MLMNDCVNNAKTLASQTGSGGLRRPRSRGPPE